MNKMNELDSEIKYSLLQTWDVIGGDCLRAKFSCGESGDDVWKVTMSKEEVIDVVIDQVDNQGFMKGDAKTYWNTLTFEQMQELTRQYFPFDIYGW